MDLFAVLFVTILLLLYTTGVINSANSAAILIATRQLTPKYAILFSTIMNFLGGICGTAVAVTISTEILNTDLIYSTPPLNAMSHILLNAAFAAIIWNMISLRLGLPCSSTHGLIGGICGAAISFTGSIDSLLWHQPYSDVWESTGLLWKIIIPFIFTPLICFFLANFTMRIFNIVLRNSIPHKAHKSFGSLQIISSALANFGFGMNTTTKFTVILVLASYSANQQGALDALPEYLSFIKFNSPSKIPLWLLCLGSFVLALGTSAGGKRITQNIGRRITHLKPVGGFVAQSVGAVVLMALSILGITAAPSHIMVFSVAGVGAGTQPKTIHKGTINKIILCGALNFPFCFLMGYILIIISRSGDWLR